MGISNDYEIMSLVCGGNEKYQRSFAINLEEAARLSIHTTAQALDYIGGRVRAIPRLQPNTGKTQFSAKGPREEEAIEVLATVVIAHVPVHNLYFRPKAMYIAIMVRRVLMAMYDEKTVDDRDYVGNKRLELFVSVLSFLLNLR